MKSLEKDNLEFINNPFFINSPYGIIVTDFDGKIIAKNLTATNSFDWSSFNFSYIYKLFEDEEIIKSKLQKLKKDKYCTLKVKTKSLYSKSNYGNVFQLEMHHYKEKNNKKEYEIIFLRSYGELNELIDLFDIHTNYFYTLINLIADPIFIKDNQKRYIIINKHFENLFGISKESIINKTDMEIFDYNEAIDYSKSDQYVLTQNLSFSETQWKKFNNPKLNIKDEFLCFNTIKTPIISDSGQIIGLIGISKDITSSQLKLLEQKSNNALFRSVEEAMYNLFESTNTEESLRKSLSLICNSLKINSSSFYVKNAENKISLITSFNRKERNFSLKWKKEIPIKSINYELIQKIERDKFIQLKYEKVKDIFFQKTKVDEINNCEIIIFPVIHNKKIKAMLIFINKKSDIPQYLSGNIENYLSYFDFSVFQKKAISIFAYFIMDFLEKKKEELILKEYSWDLDLIQKTIDISFWTENIETGEIKSSKYISSVLPIPKKKKLTRVHILSYLDKDSSRKLTRFYRRLYINNYAKCILPIYFINGKKIYSFTGKIIEKNIIIVVLDITNQKILEESLLNKIKEIEIAKKSADDANTTKTHFLAFLSHELRNMLSAIVGISSLLLEKIKGSENEKYALTIHKSGSQLLNIINEILDYSKLESNIQELNYEYFSIRDFSDKIEEYYYLIAKEKKLNFLSIVDSGLNDIVYLDKIKIHQIINNLVGNALKFTNNGHVKLNIHKTLSKNKIEERINFEIEDTGIGIPQNHISDIFKPFNQGDKTIYSKYGGTGLGLSIVKEIVNLMNGTIDVKSIEGKGSNFRIEIPFKYYDDNRNLIQSFNQADEFNSNIDINKITGISSIDNISLIESFKSDKNNKFSKTLFYLLIEDDFIFEKTTSLLNYINIKYIDIISEKINLHNIEKILNSNKNNFILIIEKPLLDKVFIDLNNNKLIVLDKDEIDMNNKSANDGIFNINKPITYKKLLDAFIYLLK